MRSEDLALLRERASGAKAILRSLEAEVASVLVVCDHSGTCGHKTIFECGCETGDPHPAGLEQETYTCTLVGKVVRCVPVEEVTGG